jgi:hypothetical protein
MHASFSSFDPGCTRKSAEIGRSWQGTLSLARRLATAAVSALLQTHPSPETVQGRPSRFDNRLKNQAS